MKQLRLQTTRRTITWININLINFVNFCSNGNYWYVHSLFFKLDSHSFCSSRVHCCSTHWILTNQFNKSANVTRMNRPTHFQLQFATIHIVFYWSEFLKKKKIQQKCGSIHSKPKRPRAMAIAYKVKTMKLLFLLPISSANKNKTWKKSAYTHLFFESVSFK